MSEEKRNEWKPVKTLGINKRLRPILCNLLLLLEEEKKNAEMKLEEVKKIIEKEKIRERTDYNKSK